MAQKWSIQVQWTETHDCYGWCDEKGKRIALGTHDPHVFFHELAHATHARLNGQLKGGPHEDQEVVAEFTACVLTHLYGLGDRTGNAWQYIKSYARDPLVAIAKALDTVGKVLELLAQLA